MDSFTERDNPARIASTGESPKGRTSQTIKFAGLPIVLLASGAAFLPEFQTLIVSDLHLEKGSKAASRGWLAPGLDSFDTLSRLRGTIEDVRPARTICLGDSFQDRNAGERMAGEDRLALDGLCGLVENWVWIAGNHDPDLPEFCDGERLDEIEIGALTLRHQPSQFRQRPEIAGHFHPKASLSAGNYRFSGPCFCVFDSLLIMPAFGAYTGGLSCSDPAIRGLNNAPPLLFMLQAGKIWRVA